MIKLKSPREISQMRQAGKITAAARSLAGKMVTPGVTTGEIDKAVHDFIVSRGAKPTFLGYGGFPGSICASVNECVIHGIPNRRVKLKAGDILSIDVGATYQGYVGDCAATFAVGQIDSEAQRLIDVTRQSFYVGIQYARVGYRVSDLSHAIQEYVESNGFSVVREYVGHGVGAEMHEEPEVPNFGKPGHGPRFVPGMVVAVEPMVNAGKAAIKVLDDGWGVVTRDGSYAAHYENTIVITDGEPEILTLCEDMC